MRVEDVARGSPGHESKTLLRGVVRQLSVQDRRSGKARGTRLHVGLKLRPPALVAVGAALLSRGISLDNKAFLGLAVPERFSCIVPAAARHRFGTPVRRQAGRFCGNERHGARKRVSCLMHGRKSLTLLRIGTREGIMSYIKYETCASGAFGQCQRKQPARYLAAVFE